MTTLERTFAEAHADWHSQVEAQRTAPHGPLSVTALHWLTATPTAYAGVPGLWSASDDGLVTALLDAADGVTDGGSAAFGAITIGPLSGIEGHTLEWGERRIEVAARGGRIALRPRDPAAPDRVAYARTATFPADPNWVITGRFVPAPRPEVTIGSAAPGLQHRFASPGTAEVEIDGIAHSLTLFGPADAHELQLIFTDATGTDPIGLTYSAARSARAIRGDDNTITIDFNRAANPPCAYSASATCPLPPAENRLTVAVRAGELRPGVQLPAGFDQRNYRDVMGAFPSGVTIITTRDENGPVGFTCQSFYSVSIDPPLVSFSISRTSKSLAAVRAHGRVVVNFLSADQQHLSAQFARSGTDKWHGVEWAPSDWNDAPVLDGVAGWVAGEVEREIEAGDHYIYLVRVGSILHAPDREPLVFHRGSYRELEYMI